MTLCMSMTDRPSKLRQIIGMLWGLWSCVVNYKFIGLLVFETEPNVGCANLINTICMDVHKIISHNKKLFTSLIISILNTGKIIYDVSYVDPT